jgi:hypothetical protein
MDYRQACNILRLDGQQLTKTSIRRAYYQAALRTHPDKDKYNRDDSAFKKVNAAYVFLCNWINIDDNVLDEHNDDNSYINIITRLLAVTTGVPVNDESITLVLDKLSNGCQNIALSMLEKMSKDSAIKVLECVFKFGDIFGVSNEMRDKMKDVVSQKIQNDTIIMLNPSLESILNDAIYALSYNDETYYIPLWHEEVIFDYKDTELFVRCIPHLPTNISIDCDNSLHVEVERKIHDIFNHEQLQVTIGGKKFTIPSQEIMITPTQTIRIRGAGVLKRDNSDPLSVKNRADILVHLKLCQSECNGVHWGDSLCD